MIIALTGATGNMGVQAVKQLIRLPDISLKLLVFRKEKRIGEIKRICKGQMHRVQFVYGNLADADACKALVENADYVVNMAAVIPPHSDQHPSKAIECNEMGVDRLVSAIESLPVQPRLIHISTVALYGNRNEKHLWARVGDPLVISPFDIYSLTKMRGEFRVLESDVKYKTVLRQTAILHSNMLSDNMHDGLMFHTCFNAPLEWVTAEDSGVLIANIIKRDMSERAANNVGDDSLEKRFWNRCFNIGGGLVNCVTGYDVLNDGFELIGGSVKDFFDPDFNATRNFHGVWFYDSAALNDMFCYQKQSTADFWKQFAQQHGILKAGKAVPKRWLKRLAIMRLFKSPNSPRYWYKHNDVAKMYAYFGGTDKYLAIGKSWNKFVLLKDCDGTGEGLRSYSYTQLKQRASAPLVNLGYDPQAQLTYEDLAAIAEMHGGKLLSQSGGVYDKLQWQNSDGQQFTAKGYTVACGHWLNPSYTNYCWDWDRLAKTDRLYAQVWYDSHDSDENRYYYFDEKFNAKYETIK